MDTREVHTRRLVLHALGEGKTVFVPYIHKVGNAGSEKPSSIMSMLALHSRDDYESLQPDKWGIPSLSASSVDERENCFGGLGLMEGSSASKDENWGLDLVVVPGVAFDHNCDRLGHGKGYYDNFFSRYSQNAKNSGGEKTPFLGTQILPRHSTHHKLTML